MLVLNRSLYEQLYIGDDIQIVYLGKSGNYKSIKLGIEAPREVKVIRAELAYHDDPRNKTVIIPARWGIPTDSESCK